MADLGTDEQTEWLGGRTPTEEEIRAEADRGAKDPFGYWWDTFVNGNNASSRVLGASGGGPNPIRTHADAVALGRSFNLARDVRNAPETDALLRAGAALPPRVNPYNAGIADRSRGAQLALIQQMNQTMQGPSVASMQGQRALGQSGQQALMHAALGGGRAAMLQSANTGQGLAGDVGQARLGEVMRSQASMGGAAGSLRGGDLRSADAQARAGLQQVQQDNVRRQFYISQGSNLANAREQAGTNREITRLQSLIKSRQQDADIVNNFANQAAGVASSATTGGGKK